MKENEECFTFSESAKVSRINALICISLDNGTVVKQYGAVCERDQARLLCYGSSVLWYFTDLSYSVQTNLFVHPCSWQNEGKDE